MRCRVPPHSLVDVDIVHKERNEVAEEKMELKQHISIHGQLWDLAVFQRNHALGRERRTGHARPWAVPADRSDGTEVPEEATDEAHTDRSGAVCQSLTYLVRDLTPVTGELVV